MIYVKRDPNLIPEKLIKVAERAQEQLEALPPNERIAFIKKKSHIWRSFKRHLHAMSYGKCWYSEVMGPHSHYHVDHFRPKAEAQRSETDKDDGYTWLAFDWDNFRYSSERSNSLSTDEDTGEIVGKSSWFPLVEGSAVACWDNRCTNIENPILLDPTKQSDVALIDIGSDGRVKPATLCTDVGKMRVKASTRYYGLNLPDTLAARRQIMIDLGDEVDKVLSLIADAEGAERPGDPVQVERHRKTLTAWTMPNRAFTLAARAKLIELGLAEILAGPEDFAAI